MKPEVLTNVLSPEDFRNIKEHFINHKEKNLLGFDENGRKLITDNDQILKKYSEKILPIARGFFKSDSLLPTYSLFAEYSDTNINLPKHTDANACTYTVDLVLYQNSPWGLWIDGVEYIANENEAICFWGEDQEHWRNSVDNNNNIVGVIFFHYVEPDHWWFTKGPEHVRVVWEQKRANAIKNKDG
jgi:hypothetical protein